MAYTYSFFDDQTAGAADLNKWVSLFVTAGISDCFADGVPYSLSKLNDIVKNNCSAGVVPESDSSLSVTVMGQTAQIAPGVAFFADGTVLEVTETESLSIPQNTACYVYLISSVKENKAYPMVSETQITGNVVPLARISETGEVLDLRRYAKGKVPSFYASDALLPGTVSFVIDAPGDYLLARGPHIYNYVALHGRVDFGNKPASALNLAYFMADLKTKTVESLSVRLNIYNGAGNFDNDDMIWLYSTNGKAVLYEDEDLYRLYRVEGELIEDDEGSLWLRVRYTGDADEDRYLPEKQGIPLACRVVLA